MTGIFISYRRDDSAAYAGRLYDRLANHFGREHIFMDIDHIEPGEDFAEVIQKQLNSVNVAIIIIGKQWLDLTDSAGQRRLDDPDDFVRLEIAAILERRIRTIPVLVGGAVIPKSSQLPDQIALLVRRNAFEISDTRFHSDVDRLIDTLKNVLIDPIPPKPPTIDHEKADPESCSSLDSKASQQVSLNSNRGKLQKRLLRITIPIILIFIFYIFEYNRDIPQEAEPPIDPVNTSTRNNQPESFQDAKDLSGPVGEIASTVSVSNTAAESIQSENTAVVASQDQIKTNFPIPSKKPQIPELVPVIEKITENIEKAPSTQTKSVSTEWIEKLTVIELTKAAEQGDVTAQARLGYIYLHGLGVYIDVSKAFMWSKKAAARGNARGQDTLGDLYFLGLGVIKDEIKAVEWYRKAAKQGWAGAQFSLGYMYFRGNGVTKDEAKALDLFRKALNPLQKAAMQGLSVEQAVIGNMYFNGYGVTKDYSKANEWYRKAAEQGYAGAQIELGSMYFNGYGVTKDYAKANEWFRKAAEQGDAAAQTWLGDMYHYGYGLTKDYARAIEWYRKAAEQGYAAAQTWLGYMFLEGLGITQDYARAAEWFQRAAEKGVARAQYFLGWMYSNGLGVIKNETIAFDWYSKAAMQGDSDAQSELDKRKR